MKKKFFFDAISLKNKRSINMDSLIIKEVTVSNKPALLTVICDGVGSQEHGTYASAAAVQELAKRLESIGDYKNLVEIVIQHIEEVNHRINDYATEHHMQTASTLALLLLTDHKYIAVNIGDSRIYQYKSKQLYQISMDHVTSTGKLSSYIGKDRIPEIFFCEGKIEKGAFLVCSDGLYKKVSHIEIANILESVTRRQIYAGLKRLVEYATDNGETDNISIALILCEG